MRLLDPALLVAPGAPGAASSAALGAAQGGSGQLLVRDNAIVLALEHVRLIIMADKVSSVYCRKSYTRLGAPQRQRRTTTSASTTRRHSV
jgi:hypothetical protein